jgi:hypothetical protein
MTRKRWIWVAAVGVLLYLHLLVGTLVAIATAFYWLLQKYLTAKQPWARLSDTRV